MRCVLGVKTHDQLGRLRVVELFTSLAWPGRGRGRGRWAGCGRASCRLRESGKRNPKQLLSSVQQSQAT